MKSPTRTHTTKKFPEHFGYAGLRQPSRNITLNVSTSLSIDFSSVDSWLEKLTIPLPAALTAGPQTIGDSKDMVIALASRLLAIAAKLQQGNRMPIFETGKILSVSLDSDDGGAEVFFQSPAMDYFPLQAQAVILNGAMEIISWTAKNPYDHNNLQKLYRNIETSILEPLKKIIPGGKSTIPILKSAFDLDIPFRHIGSNTYQLGWGKHAQLVYLSSTSRDSAIGARLSDNKANSARVLRAAGLPAPEHFIVHTKSQAISAARKLGWPVVAKPADRDRGEGVTVDIRSEPELGRAFRKIQALSKSILVEKQVPGICYRFTVANGKLIYALRRNPISVKGDGKTNVADLIRETNRAEQAKPPWEKRKLYPSDKLALEAIASAGFSLDAVPKDGEYVPLRKIESTADRGTPIDVTSLVHPENRDIAIKAAKLFRLHNAGIDIISDDISKPWHENAAVINEVNFLPALGSSIAEESMPAILAQVIQGDGRIPIDVIVGNHKALEFGEKLQREQLDKGISCVLASDPVGLTKKKRPVRSRQVGLFNKVLAMLMDTDTESLVVVIQTDEFLDTGLPFDNVSRLYISPESIRSSSADGEIAGRKRKEQLVSLIMDYTTREPIHIGDSKELKV